MGQSTITPSSSSGGSRYTGNKVDLFEGSAIYKDIDNDNDNDEKEKQKLHISQVLKQANGPPVDATSLTTESRKSDFNDDENGIGAENNIIQDDDDENDENDENANLRENEYAIDEWNERLASFDSEMERVKQVSLSLLDG